MKLVGLSRQMAMAMAAIAVGVVALIVATSLVFYYFAFSLAPEDYPKGWAPMGAGLREAKRTHKEFLDL
jgi:hypothetical protein